MNIPSSFQMLLEQLRVSRIRKNNNLIPSVFSTYNDISIFVLRWSFAIIIAAKYEIPVHNNVNRRQKLGSPKCNTTWK